MLRKYFWQIICSPHQKKCFSTILGSFWKIEFLTKIRQARTLQKLKFCAILICAKKINYLFPSSKEVFLHNFRQFLLRQARPLLKIVLRKYFYANYLFPSSKEVFLHNFRQFLENWIFDENSTGAALTKIVKILCYLKFC